MIFSFAALPVAACDDSDEYVGIAPISAELSVDDYAADRPWWHIDYDFSDPFWVISQFFSLLALICMVGSFQFKDKIKMMLLLGFGTTFLAISASFLGNYTLGVLFGLAAIRNFVFVYLDTRVKHGKYVAKWLPYFFAGVFSTLTIISTVLLVHVIQVATYGAWLEWLICITLIGLIIGNVLKGQNLMRLSFVGNRVFNIINHVYFNNAIAVIIAVLAIVSNFVYYLRMFIEWRKKRKNGDEVEPQTEVIP